MFSYFVTVWDQSMAKRETGRVSATARVSTIDTNIAGRKSELPPRVT